jgi:hypothetical protein
MTEQDQAGPAPADDAPPADRYKDLPDGVTPELAEERIKRAFAKHGARRLERRDREVAAFQASERAEAIRLNRAGALRTHVAEGVTVYFTACACKWHGLRVSDPEVALREYDAHPCTIPLDTEADHPAFRELRTVDGVLVKRPASTLALNQVLDDGQIVNSLTAPVGGEVTTDTARITTDDEDVARRFALLELK